MRNEQISSEQLAVSSGRKTVSRVKKCSVSLLFIVHCSLLTVLSCNNPFELPKQSAPVEAGYGRVSINFVGGEERTVFPAKIFDNYVYTFTKGDASLVLSPDGDGLFTLEVGEWRVDVAAYVGEISPANRAATGTGNFTVNAGPTTEVTVVLDAVVTTGYGTFIYTIQYPAIANAEITLRKLPGLTANVNLTPDSEETNNGITTVTKTAEDVPAGFYLLTVQIRNGGWHAGISEAVHIYPLLSTEYAAEFDETDLLPTVIDIANIRGITPVIGEPPVTEITETEQYTGTVTWDPNPAAFAADTTYTATITLAVKDGCLLDGVPENFFTVAGATSVSNAAGSGEITAVFTTPHSYLIVTNTTEWYSALSTIRGGGNSRRYIIDVRGNVGVGGITASTSTTGLGTVTGITVTLIGNGKLYLTSRGCIIMVGSNQTLVIDSGDLILQGVKYGQNGFSEDNNNSVVYVNGNSSKLELKNGIISDNTYSRSSAVHGGGGGVFVGNGNFTMTGGTISGNTYSNTNSRDPVRAGGGGVYVYGGSFTMTGGTISGNTESSDGGAVIGGGGGVYVGSDSSFTMTGGTISGNTKSGGSSDDGGGGVYVGSGGFGPTGIDDGNTGGNFTMSGGTISGNTSRNGGGVYLYDGRSSFTMSGGTISGNTCSGGYSYDVLYGGGVSVFMGSFTMSGGTISGNTSGAVNGEGGGVFVHNNDEYANSSFNMTGGIISGNTASYGGGVAVRGSFTMTGGTISGNTAAVGGGVNRSDFGSQFVIGGTAQIYGNTAIHSDAHNALVDVFGYGYITLGIGANAPANGMNVYVSKYTSNDVIIVQMATVEALPYFHADQDGKTIILSGTQLVIVDNIVDSITAPVWREGSPISLVIPQFTLPVGETVTAQGWQISDDGNDGWSNFTPPSTADMSWHGKYLRYYATSSSGGTWYSNTVTIRVISQTEAPREVTIAMWGWVSEWQQGTALRINANGTNLATNARLASGNLDYYTFAVNPNDVVQIYWVSGNVYDTQCGFAVYYSGDPPSPMFHPLIEMAVSSKVLVYKRFFNPSGAVGNGTLMGSFTVP